MVGKWLEAILGNRDQLARDTVGMCEAFGASITAKAGEVQGRCRGVRVRLAWAGSSGPDEGPDRTEVEAFFQSRSGLVLELRRQTDAEARHVEAGRAVDVEVGEYFFDSEFVVEAAPEATVRAIFDERLRKRLMALPWLRRITLQGGHLRLRLEERCVEHPAEVAELIDLVTTLAERMRDAEVPHAPAELAAIDTARRRRRLRRLAIGVVATIGVVVLGLVLRYV